MDVAADPNLPPLVHVEVRLDEHVVETPGTGHLRDGGYRTSRNFPLSKDC